MLPVDTPRLPKWPFLIGDAALLGLAWLIGDQSRTPFAGTPLIAIVACVAVGAIIGAIPFLTDYARKQDEALDERQRSLESLARTVAASAEQISIAANGLHEITELAQRNLQAAEQLPGKLQEKIAGLKNQLDSPRDAEREELRKELARLRASEGGRLQSAADQIAKIASDWTKLEASIQRQLAVATGALARAAQPNAPDLSGEFPSHPEPAAGEAAPPPAKRERKPRPEPAPINPPPAIPHPQSDEPPPIPTANIPEIVPVAPDSTPPIETNLVETSGSTPAISPAAPRPERKRTPRKPKPEAPVAGGSESENPQPAIRNPPSAEPALDLAEAPASPEPGSTESSRSAEPVAAAAEVIERSVSSDGATRLLVTAYIGIGNRLFIRGSGPGLSWDKGLPLQFVSIGKWRWETGEASAPVQFKLYKNDDIECAALGSQTLDPGQQEEVTATF